MAEARRPAYRACGGRRFHPGASPARTFDDSLALLSPRGKRSPAYGTGGHTNPPALTELEQADRWAERLRVVMAARGFTNVELEELCGFRTGGETAMLYFFFPADAFERLACRLEIGLGELWNQLHAD